MRYETLRYKRILNFEPDSDAWRAYVRTLSNQALCDAQALLKRHRKVVELPNTPGSLRETADLAAEILSAAMRHVVAEFYEDAARLEVARRK